MEERRCCADCRFWREPRPAHGTGHCHRHAPRPITDTAHMGQSVICPVIWPETDSLNWCGDFQRREET